MARPRRVDMELVTQAQVVAAEAADVAVDELRASDLESLLPEDHRARLVWGYVERQDLSMLVEAVKARGSNAGRAAIDPHILFVLAHNLMRMAKLAPQLIGWGTNPSKMAVQAA